MECGTSLVSELKRVATGNSRLRGTQQGKLDTPRMSITAIAAACNLNKSTVSRQTRAARLVGADGLVELAKYQAHRANGLDPSLQTSGPGLESAGSMSFNEARTANENLKAQRLTLELAELDGRLIDRHKVVALVQELGQAERDAILAWPSRAAALLAAELKIDQHALHVALDASLRAHLTERSAIALAV